MKITGCWRWLGWEQNSKWLPISIVRVFSNMSGFTILLFPSQWQGLLDSTIENVDLHRKSFFSIYRFSLPPEIPEEKWKSSLLFSLQWLQIKTETWSWTFYTALWEIVRSWTLLGNLIFDSCKFSIMSCLSKHSKHPELWPHIKEKSPTITWLMNLKSRIYKVINCFPAPWLMTRGLISALMSGSIRSWSCQPVLI